MKRRVLTLALASLLTMSGILPVYAAEEDIELSSEQEAVIEEEMEDENDLAIVDDGTEEIVSGAEEESVELVAGLPESLHPYANAFQSKKYFFDKEYNEYGEVEKVYHKIHFSSDTFVETGFDFIVVHDVVDGLTISNKTYTGNELANKWLVVAGDVLTVDIDADGSKNYYGFAVDQMQTLRLPDTDELPYFNRTQTASGVRLSIIMDEYSGKTGYFRITRSMGSLVDKSEVVYLNSDYVPEDEEDPGDDEGYCIFYYDDNDSSLVPGTLYNYTVERVYNIKNSDAKIAGIPYSREVFYFAHTYVESVCSNISSKTGKSVIQLKWSGDSNAHEYDIYTLGYDVKNKSYKKSSKLEKTIKDNTVTTTTFQSGQCSHSTVAYPTCGLIWVCPFKVITASYGSVGYGRAAPYGDLHNVENIALTKKSTGIKIDFSTYGKKHQVSGYIIERSTNNGSFERVVKLTKAKAKDAGYVYTDKTVKKGKTYKYRIIPYYNWSGTVIKSGENKLTISKTLSLEKSGLLKKRPTMKF